MNLGYACINMTLGEEGITTNRSMKAATLNSKGTQYASQLALQNAQDLVKVIEWNAKNNIKFFRVSSNLFPWGNKLNVEQFPDFAEIRSTLERAGKIALETNQRITSHPGQYNLLASPKEEVITTTVRDLELHALTFDLMGLSSTPYNKINIHMGAAYGDKTSAAKTWISNLKHLSKSCLDRLTVENDDKGTMFSVKDLHDMVYQETGIPIVFDYHHHKFCTGGLTEQEALELAISTWGDIVPVVHYSESKALHENINVKPQAHSDYVDGPINNYGHNIDVMIEAKAKELAVLKYLSKNL
jgi:UV DNA damage endonuclease